MEEKCCCVISFSGRKNGNCEKIGRLICSLLQNAELYSFADFTLQPCGGCHYECFDTREECPYIDDMECTLLEKIVKCKRAYYILPNYCDYPCANFFVFNERSQCYFQHRPKLLDAYEDVRKKFIVVSNTNEENFKLALSYHTAKAPEILFLSAKKYGKVSVHSDLLDSVQAAAEIRRFVES